MRLRRPRLRRLGLAGLGYARLDQAWPAEAKATEAEAGEAEPAEAQDAEAEASEAENQQQRFASKNDEQALFFIAFVRVDKKLFPKFSGFKQSAKTDAVARTAWIGGDRRSAATAQLFLQTARLQHHSCSLHEFEGADMPVYLHQAY